MSTNKKAKVTVLNRLLDLGLFENQKTAQAAVMAGNVIVNDQRVIKPSDKVPADAKVRVKGQKRFVSRAGEKLFQALKKLGIADQMRDKKIMDVGASTGGFTDCCLQLGAKSAVCLDVGTNQLDWSLRKDSRITCIEQMNFLDFDPETLKDPIDWVVSDISFNSLCTFADQFKKLSNANKPAHFLLLVKPQFELDREHVPKGGIVLDEDLHNLAIEKVKNCFEHKGFETKDILPSPVRGQKGNQEYFIYFVL